MKPLLFSMPGSVLLGEQLRHFLICEKAAMQVHRFPDGESCPRLDAVVAGRDVIFVCALDHPDEKIMAIYLAACTARELGAKSVGLVIPYLPYMRQDARFNEGEGITSIHFARLISSCCDWLVTVDPHLHRHHSLSDIYTVSTKLVQAAPEISAWIAENVERPVIVGPDSESEQWAAEVAKAIGCPYTVLQKIRSGDCDVEVSIPDASRWHGMTPVLVDDIVSTARTMIAAAVQIKLAGMAAPVCIAVHALFADDAYGVLKRAGVDRIATCNTVDHVTNAIDLCPAIARGIESLLSGS